MTPERWREVKGLFDRVLGAPEEAREAFLDEACRDDPALREEVEVLLASHLQRDPSLDAVGEEPDAEFEAKPDFDLATPTTEFQLCAKCGTSNSPDSNFCKQCGNRFSTTGTISPDETGSGDGEAAPAPVRPVSRGAVIHDRYEIQAPVGRGGMGVVYRAKDRKSDREVAIKFLRLSNEQRKGAFKRFSREIQIAKKLDHANLVRLLAAGRWEGNEFLVMEYVPGETLKDKVRRRILGDTKAVVGVLVQICDALQAAHDTGVVHRDVKPSNVLIDESGKVKICDFGLAFTEGTDLTRITRTGDCMGTPEYMAPEQVEGRRVDSRADIYSLGVLMYEAFTGEPPFRASTPMAVAMQHVNRPPVAPSRANPNLPSHIEKIILKCLEKAPDKRFQTIAEVRRTLIRGVGRRERIEHKETGDVILLGEGETGFELVIQSRRKLPPWDENTALKFRDAFYKMKSHAMISNPSHPFRYTFVPWPDALAFRNVVEYENWPGGPLDRLRNLLR